VVWFVLQSAVGAVIAVYVVKGMQQHVLLRYVMRGVDTEFTMSAGILGSLFVFLLALLVLASLLELRPWARLVMLIVGWISVFSAAINLLTVPSTVELLRPAWHRGRSIGGVGCRARLHETAGPGVLVVGDLHAAVQSRGVGRLHPPRTFRSGATGGGSLIAARRPGSLDPGRPG